MTRPLIVRVGDLLREPGSQRSVQRSYDPPHVATTVAEVDPDRPVEVDVVVTAMAGGVEIIGDVTYAYRGICRRCLDPLAAVEEVPVRELAQRDPVDDEIFPIDGDALDLAPVVRELLIGSLPLAPLCREDCPGPAPERFPTTTEDEAAAVRAAEEAEREPQIDPRWAALSDLRLDDPADDPADEPADEAGEERRGDQAGDDAPRD